MIYRINYPSDKKKIHEVIDLLSEKKQWEITINLKREKRSVSQNSLYWLWIGCICDETGGDKEEVHNELRYSYLPSESVRTMGREIILRPISTTKLDTGQFKNYLDRIQVFASTELGITLPDPGDLHFAEFYDRYKDFI
jgi:hypothetical protein